MYDICMCVCMYVFIYSSTRCFTCSYPGTQAMKAFEFSFVIHIKLKENMDSQVA